MSLTSPLILIVDDMEDNLILLSTILKRHGYRSMVAANGPDAVRKALEHVPSLLLLDLNMPGMSGLEVLRHLRPQQAMVDTGIIVLTAATSIDDVIEAFQAGADDFIRKPYHQLELQARISSVLTLRDVQRQLRMANRDLDTLNHELEERVQEQVTELEKANRLKRFFSPQVAETYLQRDDQSYARHERRMVTVVFVDIRGFTPFAEQASADLLMRFLQDMHAALGPVVYQYGATIERFTGDGLMCFLNAPNDVPEHPLQAVLMAQKLMQAYRERPRSHAYPDLKIGIGIATGEATTGLIGFEGRVDYAAIGTVTNIAARLCSVALGDQILLAQSTYELISTPDLKIEKAGLIPLKGLSSPLQAYLA